MDGYFDGDWPGPYGVSFGGSEFEAPPEKYRTWERAVIPASEWVPGIPLYTHPHWAMESLQAVRHLFDILDEGEQVMEGFVERAHWGLDWRLCVPCLVLWTGEPPDPRCWACGRETPAVAPSWRRITGESRY